MHLFLMTTELLDIQFERLALCGLLVSVSLVKKSHETAKNVGEKCLFVSIMGKTTNHNREN